VVIRRVIKISFASLIILKKKKPQKASEVAFGFGDINRAI
jgi:hypothetical protein